LLEQGKLGATEHAAFDEFEFMHLSLDKSIAVDLSESCNDWFLIPENTLSKSLKFLDLAIFDSRELCIQTFSPTLAYHRQEFPDQPIGHLSRATGLTNERECRLLLLGEICWLTNEEPDGITCLELLRW